MTDDTPTRGLNPFEGIEPPASLRMLIALKTMKAPGEVYYGTAPTPRRFALRDRRRRRAEARRGAVAARSAFARRSA